MYDCWDFINTYFQLKAISKNLLELYKAIVKNLEIYHLFSNGSIVSDMLKGC